MGYDPDRCFIRAVLDDKTCDFCRATHGRKLSDLTAEGLGLPPYHAEPENPCRCAVWGPSPIEAIYLNTMKPNNELSPAEVIKMPLKEFAGRFGFVPVDALEKYYFASNAKRLEPLIREALEAGVIGDIPLGHVVME